MKRFQKFLLILGASFICVAVVIEWGNSKKLKDENQRLAAELASMRSAREVNPQHVPRGISKSELEELLRLRSEIGWLRIQKTQLEQLRAENQQLKETIDSEKDSIQARWKFRLSYLRTNDIEPAGYSDLVPEMAEALTNSEPSIRTEATRVLRRIGLDRLLNTNLTAEDVADLKNAAKAAMPGVLPLLKDPDPLVRANAAITLGFLHEDTDEVVPALIENLNSDQVRDVGSAAKALMRLQGDARSAVPALLPITQSSNPDLRQLAIDAVKEIDPAAARNAGFE